MKTENGEKIDERTIMLDTCYTYKINYWIDGDYWSEIKTINFGTYNERAEEVYYDIQENLYKYIKKLDYIIKNTSEDYDGGYCYLKVELISTSFLNDVEYSNIEDRFLLNVEKIREIFIERRGK